jgi:hypothetical protein
MYLQKNSFIEKDDFVINTKTGTAGCVSALTNGTVRCRVASPDGGPARNYVWEVSQVRVLSVGEMLKQCTCADAPHHASCPLSAANSESSAPPPSDLDMGPSRYFPSTRKYRAKERSRVIDQLRSQVDYPSDYVWIDADERPRRSQQAAYKEAPKKPDPHSISTADLIKDEVRLLEEQQAEEARGNTYPLRTSAPTGPRAVEESSINPEDLLLKKRKGEW